MRFWAVIVLILVVGRTSLSLNHPSNDRDQAAAETQQSPGVYEKIIQRRDTTTSPQYSVQYTYSYRPEGGFAHGQIRGSGKPTQHPQQQPQQQQSRVISVDQGHSEYQQSNRYVLPPASAQQTRFVYADPQHPHNNHQHDVQDLNGVRISPSSLAHHAHQQTLSPGGGPGSSYYPHLYRTDHGYYYFLSPTNEQRDNSHFSNPAHRLTHVPQQQQQSLHSAHLQHPSQPNSENNLHVYSSGQVVVPHHPPERALFNNVHYVPHSNVPTTGVYTSRHGPGGGGGGVDYQQLVAAHSGFVPRASNTHPVVEHHHPLQFPQHQQQQQPRVYALHDNKNEHHQQQQQFQQHHDSPHVEYHQIFPQFSPSAYPHHHQQVRRSSNDNKPLYPESLYYQQQYHSAASEVQEQKVVAPEEEHLSETGNSLEGVKEQTSAAAKSTPTILHPVAYFKGKEAGVAGGSQEKGQLHYVSPIPAPETSDLLEDHLYGETNHYPFFPA